MKHHMLDFSENAEYFSSENWNGLELLDFFFFLKFQVTISRNMKMLLQ